MIANEDYFSMYLEYAGVGHSECPTIFHRWSSISLIGALLGRQVYYPFGHSFIYPNQYIMLMGSPGTRKSTAINTSTRLAKLTGYTRFSADRTSKERFLMDMKQLDDDLDGDALEVLTLDEPAETYVVAEEFTDFVGQNNMEFVTMLTTLWDNKPDYSNPKIHGKSVKVHKPTVNIIGGNTAQGFSLAFPPEALGNGFLSRLIFVHGESNGHRITFPRKADPIITGYLADLLKEMRLSCKGELTISYETEQLVERMYKEAIEVDDARFKHYNSRRLTHLIKIAICICCSNLRTNITEEDFLRANTLLYYTENKMPKALGEFGKSKYSEVANSILEYIGHSTKPVGVNALWKHVHQDLSKQQELTDILRNLLQAGKIQEKTLLGNVGFLLRHEVRKEWPPELILDDWLTLEERG